jgi:hypothetical protein
MPIYVKYGVYAADPPRAVRSFVPAQLVPDRRLSRFVPNGYIFEFKYGAKSDGPGLLTSSSLGSGYLTLSVEIVLGIP